VTKTYIFHLSLVTIPHTHHNTLAKCEEPAHKSRAEPSVCENTTYFPAFTGDNTTYSFLLHCDGHSPHKSLSEPSVCEEITYFPAFTGDNTTYSFSLHCPGPLVTDVTLPHTHSSNTADCPDFCDKHYILHNAIQYPIISWCVPDQPWQGPWA
jgi:hypothetical protein